MLVPRVYWTKCGELALIMPATPTYFLTMFCTKRVVSSSTLVNLERTSDWSVREAAGVHLLDTYYIAL
jgi:hypothetical protein